MASIENNPGVLRILSDKDDSMQGAKIQTPKNPMPSFQALKISSKYVSWYNTIKNDYAQNYGTRRGCAGTTTKLQIVLKTQENIYSNPSTPKILAKIS